jgi:hypothetical protein
VCRPQLADPSIPHRATCPNCRAHASSSRCRRPRRGSVPRPRSRRARRRPSRSTSACAGRPRPRCPHDRASSTNATVPDRASSLASLENLHGCVCCWRIGRQHPGGRPPRGERSYQVRPILEGKNRGRHFVRKTPLAGSQIALEPDLGSASDPTRAVTRAGTEIQHRDRFPLPPAPRRAIALATFQWPEIRPRSRPLRPRRRSGRTASAYAKR